MSEKKKKLKLTLAIKFVLLNCRIVRRIIVENKLFSFFFDQFLTFLFSNFNQKSKFTLPI